ncbi:unnamed protein product [Rotaria magnacalcarata]|uniref:Uncharacterized protein n=3 Tax=Rotaria magnacalcarata TaxID=392030 RepID=A0A819RIK7_9BILA|nr:unnamed protein product [Rotaria magnacalcarata]
MAQKEFLYQVEREHRCHHCDRALRPKQYVLFNHPAKAFEIDCMVNRGLVDEVFIVHEHFKDVNQNYIRKKEELILKLNSAIKISRNYAQ